LFSPEPDLRICSKHSRSFETFEDSSQFFSKSTRNLFSVGHVMRSVFFRNVRQMGHSPVVGIRQLERRHSLHTLCVDGVSTGFSADSEHVWHSVFSARQMPSITSSMYALVGTWDCLYWSGMVSICFQEPSSKLVQVSVLLWISLTAYAQTIQKQGNRKNSRRLVFFLLTSCWCYLKLYPSFLRGSSRIES